MPANSWHTPSQNDVGPGTGTTQPAIFFSPRGIVLGIDMLLNCKGDAPWTCTTIHRRWPSAMMHVGIEIRKTAGWEICHLAFVKVISPMPTLNLPKMTVTFSLRGCQWGAIRYPSGIFKRTV